MIQQCSINFMDYYTSKVVRSICPGVSHRMLDHWVDSNVIDPSMVLVTHARQKHIYLFGFEDIVRIRLVKSLRDSGISLHKIRNAIGHLRTKRQKAWHAAWIVTDGGKLYEATDDPKVVESLTRGEMGQFVLSVIALQSTKDFVRERLEEYDPIDLSRYDGELCDWYRVPESA